MRMLAGLLFALLVSVSANAQDSPFRKELKRADLTGTNMEVVTSISEIKPGETSTLHIHHGEESFYVLQGSTIELPDGKQAPLPTGAAGPTKAINACTDVGDQATQPRATEGYASVQTWLRQI